MKPSTDITFIVDHFAADCGVRFRYGQLVQHCLRKGLKVSMVTDHQPLDFPSGIQNWLTLKVPDRQAGQKFRRRPFLALAGNEDEAVDPQIFCQQHEMDPSDALWLDAWNHSSEWVLPAIEQMAAFISEEAPKRTLVATQSFLGFAATRLDLPQPAVSFHTNYGAFYGARLGLGKQEAFSSIMQAINNRIAREFLYRFPTGFLSSRQALQAYDNASDSKTAFHEFPGGVNADLFRPVSNPRPGKKLKILFVGRIAEEKGLGLLIHAARHLKNCEWTIVGTGVQQNELRAALPDAQFLGSISQNALAQIMPHHDIFLFPAKWDTFGLSALEAMACGVPVVAVEGSGIAERIRKHQAGLVVPDSPALLLEAMQTLADSPQSRKTMGGNGRAIAENMTWERVCDGFLEEFLDHIVI